MKQFPSLRVTLAVLAAASGASVVAVVPARAQSPDWTVFLNVRPDPSPYVADWESDPSIVTLVLSYTGAGGVAFYLDGRVMRGTESVVAGRSTAFEFVRASQLVLTTRDGIWEANSVTYQASLRDLLEQTGRLPDGEYQFCVDVRQGLPEAGPGALLATDCAGFSITAPQPPGLITPADGDTVVQAFPTFVWTPVLLGPNARVSFHVRVAAVLPGQAPLEAINNVPVFEGDVDQAFAPYPRDALPLESGERYAWQVQATDDAGLPVGERQGKSEIWTFVFAPAGPVTPPPITEDEDTPVVSRFQWAEVEVEVLALKDSSFANYSGTGRLKVVPGLFEPEFPFRGLRLTPDGARVDYAPRHVVRMPDIGSAFDWVNVLPLPFVVMIEKLVLVADSATGDRHVGLSGAGVVITSYANPFPPAEQPEPDPSNPTMTDAEQAAAEEPCREVAEYDSELTEIPGTRQTVCTDATEESAAPSDALLQRSQDWGTTAEQGVAGLQELARRHFYFLFQDVHIGDRGPEGRLVMARDFRSANWGMPGFEMVLYRDSTSLTLADGTGTLDLKGDFRIPPGTGLVLDRTAAIADSMAEAGKLDSLEQTAADSAVTLKIRRARLSTTGEFYLETEGIPLARLGRTGLKLRTGDAVVDLSSELSPAGREAGWRGVYLDSGRVFLPLAWNTWGDLAGIAQDTSPATVLGRQLSIDAQGFSGDISASNLQEIGPIGFGGFSGVLDSLRFKFTAGTLDTGFVSGRLDVPFFTTPIEYQVGFTPVGVDRAYVRLEADQWIDMPALNARLQIQRGEFVYERPVGTLTVDALLTIDRGGVALERAQVYGLSVSNDGGIKLGAGWLVFDSGYEGTFQNFPVALDSIGFGSGTDGNEVWLGVAGQFALGDNLPSGSSAFRIFAKRSAPGAPWNFSRLSVDRFKISFENAVANFEGDVQYVQDDSVYGDAFKAAVALSVQDQFSAAGTFIAGATTFRYWYVDARLVLPPPGIQLGPLPLAIWGFAGGAYARMRANIDTLTLKATYVPDQATAFGLKAAVSIGTSGNQGYVWNADAWLEAAASANGGIQSLTLRGDNWMLTEVARREKKLWGTVLADLPVSRPVLHANLTVNVDLKPMLTGNGWAELHFAPDDWYVNVGTPQRPDSLTLLPGTLNLQSTAYFQLDEDGVGAGFATFFEKEKTVGRFKGRVAAGYEAAAELRYRPFRATGDGELWGEIVAKVKALGNWYELLSGTARATMAFEFPDPTRVWGKIKLKYKIAGGAAKGTYRMRYSWGGSGDDDADDDAPFVLIAATSPLPGDTGASVSGVSYYLGMSEGVEYGTDDGVYRLRLAAVPVIGRRTVTVVGGRLGAPSRTLVTWPSIGTLQRVWDDERATFTLVAPGYATLEPGARYRAIVMFALDKQTNDGWQTQQSVTDTLEFTTSGVPPILAQLVSETDPRGAASPMYFGGPNAGAVRVRFTNTHPDLTSGAAVGRLVANGTDTVAGSWGTASYPFAMRTLQNDPTLYRFSPGAGALAPGTSYRFVLVQNDSTAQQHYAVSFTTSRYASFAEHVGTSAVTVEPDRGPGPLSGAGTYLRGVRVILTGQEPIEWNDIDSIEVIGVTAGWQVLPRTRCQWVGGSGPAALSLGATVLKLCGATPTYENLLNVEFTAPTDAGLPASSTAAVTVRLNHRREGWHTFTWQIPSAIVQIVDTPVTTTQSTTPPPTVDVTPPRQTTQRGR